MLLSDVLCAERTRAAEELLHFLLDERRTNRKLFHLSPKRYSRTANTHLRHERYGCNNHRRSIRQDDDRPSFFS